MNREEAVFSLHAAINQLITAVGILASRESVPTGNIKINVGENESGITILQNGTVICTPEGYEGRDRKQIKLFPVADYPTSAIVSPDYDPLIGGQLCNVCNGKGTLP
jgi:hypothetical protein